MKRIRKGKSINMGAWDLYAPIYKRIMRGEQKKFRAVYDDVFEAVKGKRVLEIGTGPGVLAKNIANISKEVVATDYSERMINGAKKDGGAENLVFEVADAHELPYMDKDFDVVIIANVLHVIPKPEIALKEIDRVLKDEGVLIAPNYIHKTQKSKAKLWYKILKIAGIKFENSWTDDEYVEFLNKNGWKVIKKKFLDTRIAMLYLECKREKECI